MLFSLQICCLSAHNDCGVICVASWLLSVLQDPLTLQNPVVFHRRNLIKALLEAEIKICRLLLIF